MKIRMGAVRIIPVFLWSVKKRVRSHAGTLAYNVSVQEQQAPGPRREYESMVFRLGSSSLVGGKTRESALTCIQDPLCRDQLPLHTKCCLFVLVFSGNLYDNILGHSLHIFVLG